MNNYICSDLHFGHENIIKHCKRPFVDGKDMDSTLINLFQEKVKDEDHVYHLGDFMYGGKPKIGDFFNIFEQLPGKWHFILGNHDRRTLEKWRHELVKDKRIEEVEFYKRLVVDNTLFILFHYEMAAWDQKHWRKFPEATRKYKATYHLFGHTHSSPDRTFELDTMDVGIDTTEFQLFTFEEIVSKYFQEKHLTTLDGVLQ